MKYEKQYMTIIVNRFQGTLNNLSGQFAEYQLATAFRGKKGRIRRDYVRNEASERRSALLIFDGITKEENRKAK